MNKQSPDHPLFLRKWRIAVRPFSFPASAMPVLFGSVLAWTIGGARPHIALFFLTLLAMTSLHAGANILSDISDFKRGLDKVPTPVSGAIVRGLMGTREAMIGASLLLAVGAVLGLVIAWKVGAVILLLGAAGLVIGVFYTVPPFALKYHALGDLAVFLDFGLLGALGAWTVQTGTPSWVPVTWSVPIAMLVVAILHANNWRDIAGDRDGAIRTVASILGDRGSLAYYGFLVFGAFGYVIVAMAVTRFAALRPVMPMTCALVLLAYPLAARLWTRALRRASPKEPLDFLALDGATAQLNLLFGLLYTGGLVLSALVRGLA